MMAITAAALVLIHSVNSFALKEKRDPKSSSVAWLRERV